MRQEVISTGTFNIHGREYHTQTIYPMGRQRPQYQMWYVWQKHQTGTVFASERGFERWLASMMQPTQAKLF